MAHKLEHFFLARQRVNLPLNIFDETLSSSPLGAASSRGYVTVTKVGRGSMLLRTKSAAYYNTRYRLLNIAPGI